VRLANFILREIKPILAEWEAFAATRLPAAEKLTPLALRDHAEQILRAIAKDLDTTQTSSEQSAKSRGEVAKRIGAPETAAQTHGLLRAKSGFDINQMASEYRALRASVLRMWIDACAPQPPDADDIIRFNEAIDQALAESISYYSARTEQARDLFLGMLGHDMRTPLQTIQLTATHLAKMNAGQRVSDAATRLMKSGALMQSLLDDMVEFNRIALGVGLPVNRTHCDMGKLFEAEVAQLRAAYPQRRIELEVHGSAVGSWDGLYLQRLLGNLVTNAIKYGAQGTPVRVNLIGQAHDVVIEVHNQGSPIGPSMLESIFDPLRRGLQLDEPGRSDGSLGLGLHISREVAKAHGGDIEARSEQNETVFITRLPREPRL